MSELNPVFFASGCAHMCAHIGRGTEPVCKLRMSVYEEQTRFHGLFSVQIWPHVVLVIDCDLGGCGLADELWNIQFSVRN